MANSGNRLQQARYWILTINDDDAGNSWERPNNLPDGVVWLRGQKEIGTTTHRPHWQLFATFSRAVRLAAVKRVFSDRCFAEPSRSNAAEAYVFKDDTAVPGTRFELGAKPFNRSSSTDWESTKSLAKRGALDECPPDVYIRYYRSLKQISVDNMEVPPNMPDVTGLWVYGPPGVGKSFYVREHYGNSLYLKPQNRWWDGYQGQKYVLLDDFDCKNVMGHYLKIWADRYSFVCESKGSSCVIRPQKFIVTSNYTPEQLHDDPIVASAIRRRFYFIHIPLRLH